MSRITLWGFYNFTEQKLFDDIRLPEEYDKKTLVDLIMIESGDLYTYYQQPAFLKLQIENFFNRRYDDFKRMYAALYSEYDPLENYDRKEDWGEKFKEHVNGTASDNTSDSSSGTSLSQVSAMDSNDFVNDGRGETSSSGESHATTSNEADRNNESEHSGRIHGNIGVTTSMELIESELKLREYDLYERIARLFEKQIIFQEY